MARSTSRNPSPPGLLDETLAGTLGVSALLALAHDPLGHGVLDLLADQELDLETSDLRLIRTKYKPSRKLSAYYQAPGGRHVAVVWTQETVQVLVSPHDPAMPQLAGLHDAAYLSVLLAAMDQSAEPLTGPRVHTVRYRPGQRHVLWVTEPGQRGVYLKIDRDNSGARSIPIARELRARVAQQSQGASLAEPIGYAVADRAAVWRSAAGAALWQRLDGNPALVARLLHLVGRAVRVLHDTALDELPVDEGAAPRDAHAEVAATIRAGEHIAALLPPVGADYLGLIDNLAEALDHIATEAPTFTHGDLKCDNVLALGEQVRLLDLDRCGPADPALDLGKFVADLRWWGGDDENRVLNLIAAFREGYGECDNARWERATLLASLFQLKLVARRAAIHDPAWESEVRQRVASAAPVLAQGA